jgi:uncharacterized protein YuzE
MEPIRLEMEDPLVAYVRLGDGPRRRGLHVPIAGIEHAAEIPALNDIVLDFDDDGRLVGIEILRPADWLPRDLAPTPPHERDRTRRPS